MTRESDTQAEQECEPDWPGILICVPCEQLVDADLSDERTACEHTWDEAREIGDLSDEEWAMFRHDVYLQELVSDDPRCENMLVHELSSVTYDLTAAEALPDDYDERDGVEKMVFLDPDESSRTAT